MQQIIRRPDGTVGFKANTLVWRLLQEARKHGFGMNELADVECSIEDREQFLQLIGYSIEGYKELSYVRSSSVAEAEEAARVFQAAERVEAERSANRRT